MVEQGTDPAELAYIEPPEETAAVEAFKVKLERDGVAYHEEFFEELEGKYRYIQIDLPSGGRKRRLSISAERAANAIGGNFRDVHHVPGYEALWFKATRTIEAALEGGAGAGMADKSIGWVLRRLGADAVDGIPQPLEMPTVIPGLTVSLGGAGVELGLLEGHRLRIRPSLRIREVQAETVDESRDLLERIGNSVLFRIDLLAGMNVQLKRERVRASRSRLREGTALTSAAPVLSAQYHREPMALYWYARRADGMPLLQFLAFYQLLEYYFPLYVDRDAQVALRRQLKNPRFDVDSDEQVARLVGAVRSHSPGGYRGSEVHQLVAALRGCVSIRELQDWLREDEEREKYFRSQEAKKLAEQRVNARDDQPDLREQAGRRIYAIRCRIVHTKSEDEEGDLLLPFSDEAQGMGHDIDLVQFLAQQMLVACSTKLTL